MTPLPEPGSRFAERYVIESELGHGTAGVVFAATHEDLRQRVAIKVLRESDPVAVERMLREARATIALQSEHVVRVMDVGRERGRVYLVMEHLDGADLAATLRQRGPLPLAEAVDHVLQACAGVAEAHAHGVVHRDLKPSNLFLTRRGDGSPLVKVLDFGISKTTGDGDAAAEASLTGPAEVLGSPMYMSPEQVRGARDVDHRSDIWALGVILFRLLTGKAPFVAGSNVGTALAAVLESEPASLRGERPDVPRELEAIVLRCLSKGAIERFDSAAALATALAPFGSDDGRASVVRLVRDRAPVKVTRRRWPLVAACAVVGAALAVTVVLSARTHAAALDAPSADLPAVAPSSAAAAPTPTPTPSSAATTTEAAVTPVVTPKTALPAPPSVVAPSPRRSPGRPRPASNSSVVRSAATDDRY